MRNYRRKTQQKSNVAGGNSNGFVLGILDDSAQQFCTNRHRTQYHEKASPKPRKKDGNLHIAIIPPHQLSAPRVKTFSRVRSLGHAKASFRATLVCSAGRTRVKRSKRCRRTFSPPDHARTSRSAERKPVLTVRVLSDGRKQKTPELRSDASVFAPRVGLEPTTNSLTASCSTIELPRNVSRSIANRRHISNDMYRRNLCEVIYRRTARMIQMRTHAPRMATTKL